MNRTAILLTFFIISFIFHLFAHLDRNSLSIKGGETVLPGESMTITWKMTHAHPINHIIYFRPDGETDWTIVDTVKGQPSALDYSYEWSVPQSASTSAQVRIFLPEFSKSPSDKADDFTLISEPFTIASPKVSVPSVRSITSNRHTVSATRYRSFDLKGRVIGDHPLFQGAECLITDRKIYIRNLRR